MVELKLLHSEIKVIKKEIKVFNETKYITAVQRKTYIPVTVTLQESAKTSFNFNVSQWNQASFQANFGPFLLVHLT